MRQIILSLLAGLITICSYPQNFKEIPDDFVDNALKHVEKLCDFGIRRHDAPSGSLTVKYIKEQFEKNDLNVKIDTFSFGGVILKNRSIVLDNDSIRVQSILVNQTLETDITIKGELLVLDENNLIREDLNDKIIFTSQSNNTLLLKNYSPKAIVALRNEELEKIRNKDEQVTELKVKGNSIEHLEESYNVIGTYRNYNKSRKDILITAHWDSQGGPGADDNASGVSIILELSDYFSEYQSQINYNLKFIALGAEEIGLKGSKAYVLKYNDDVVENGLINLNIDGVGGGKKPYIEMRNPVKFKNPDTGEWMEIITYSDYAENWYTTFLEVYRNSSSAKIYPGWLVENIKSAMNKANINYYKASCCSGADHRSFAYLDMPVVYLGMTKDYEKNIHHTENDVPKDYFRNSLEIAGKTAQCILIEIGENLEQTYP